MRWSTILVCLCSLATGCGGRKYSGEQRFPLAGKVTVNGEPMESGLISFVPLSGDEKARVAGNPIKDGTYSIVEEKGLTAGLYRVEIHWNVKTGRKVLDIDTGEPVMDELKEGLPPKYHKDSELTAEVSENQTTFDFDLKAESK